MKNIEWIHKIHKTDKNTEKMSINPIQDGHFQGCSRMEAPLPKICHTYPTMMELGTVIPYLKKIQKIY